ncbi:hypothetical protein WR25_25252 [Diploscapter pachys]|uniref:TIL domain-containing protein n=1 Tax=Diploscapter pachys TaxID=2018661 RepID=A0A2A2LE94_9BILA|nr:hypothetical protein WR25_25252 [Diploscapter pachys]
MRYNNLLKYLLFLLLVVFLICDALSVPKHRHHGRRRHRHVKKFPPRSERSPKDCTHLEVHMRCGPEKYCEKSCENMFSPPNCINSLTNPKCYYPRCVCKEGYVRDEKGKCIKPHKCPNMYFEGALEPEANIFLYAFENALMIEFRPVKFTNLHSHKVKKLRGNRLEPYEDKKVKV